MLPRDSTGSMSFEWCTVSRSRGLKEDVKCRSAMLSIKKRSDSAKKGTLTTGPYSAAVGRPATPLTPVLISGNTGDMLGHVFGHPGPLARPLEASRAACSTTRPSRSRSPGGGRIGPNPDPGPKILEIRKNHRFLKCSVGLENLTESSSDRYLSPCRVVCDGYNLEVSSESPAACGF